jgi:LPS export ABC transporter permease LptF/LPS export ABC transporter permease LptG
MRVGGTRLIERYIARAIIPYLLLALFLLTMILFVQQSSRFAELLLLTQVPLSLLSEVAVSLFPNVLVFTLPMATLAGTIIGFSRMSSDSELVSIRASGVSGWNILFTPLLIGLLLSACGFYINFTAAPWAARTLRRAGLQAALKKLDSPVEPRIFNTDIPGYVVYVGEGDKAQGRWESVFIYSQDKSGATRLITARSGRIDAAAEQSELVLSDAVATTLPGKTDVKGQYVTERLAQLRVVLETGRKGLLERLQRDDPDTDEMSFEELWAAGHVQGGKEVRDAGILFHKRLSLSFAPLVFALLGGSLSMRFKRGGKGWGSLLSLLTLIAYYMLSLLGDQLARKGTVEPLTGAWIATVAAIAVSCVLLLKNRWSLRDLFGRPAARRSARAEAGVAATKVSPLSVRERRRLGFPSMLDRSLLRSLSINCAFSYAALLAVFLIFTLFELWRFINPARTGFGLVAGYLFFLLPLATVQLLPASLLIAVLLTYALIARRSEAVAWWASGQSVYRLMLPGVAFALLVGLANWTVQERLMPEANIRQDALRAQIRGGVAQAVTGSGRQWLASAPGSSAQKRIYAYEYEGGQGGLKEPVIYEFDPEGVHLSRIVTGHKGVWQEGREVDALLVQGATTIQLAGGRLDKREGTDVLLEGGVSEELFKLKLNKPAHLNASQLSDYITALRPSGRNLTPLLIALQRKYAEPHTAWIMALFGIPLALSFGRRSAVAALSSAVGISLAYWGAAGIFQQLGEYGLLSPTVAAWSPLLIFATLGVYLLTRMRT